MTRRGRAARGAVDLKDVIHARYPSLPDNQRKVADFLLQHVREAPLYSVVAIERECGVSKATVVRFAQNLGFSGFLELREILRKGVQSELRLQDHLPLLIRSNGTETLSAVAHQDVRNINQTINHLDRKTFTEVTQLILKAGQVYTFGLGISSLMSEILSYSLNQVAVRSRPFLHGSQTFVEQLGLVTKKDLLIAFSFPPYSRETIDVAQAASERQIPLVAITDKHTAPLTFFAEKVLPIRSQNMLFTNSISAISVLINALTTEVAKRNRTRVVAMQEDTHRRLTAGGHFDETARHP
jgi:DNA-binding MurR/RpiR family transcriptional regulator